MPTNAQIQIHFPLPGEWGQFTLTALWQDAQGYACRRSYAPQDIPEEHLGTLQGIVSSLIALDEPWQATHVAARLHGESAGEEAVELIIHARRADGATRSFCSEDYPQLRLADAAVIAAFRQLTTQQN